MIYKINRSASSANFLQWSDDIELVCNELQMISRSPRVTNRKMRLFGMVEAIELTGVTKYQWLKFIKENHDSLEYTNEGPGSRPRLSLGELRTLQKKIGIAAKRPAGEKAVRLLVAQFTSGSQKTSLATHIAQYLAIRGLKVLLVDADGQGTASRIMGFIPDAIATENTLKNAFSHLHGESETFRAGSLNPLATHFDGVDCVPANLELSGLDFDIAANIVNGGEREIFKPLETALDKVEKEDEYDVVLFDSPPSFSIMAVSLAWVSSGMIVPMPAEVPDFAGTGDFCRMLGSNMNILSNAFKLPDKVWNPVMVIHGRVSGSDASKMVQTVSTRVFKHIRCENVIKQSQSATNCLATFQTVFEATSKTQDPRGLKIARDMYCQLGNSVLEAILDVWK